MWQLLWEFLTRKKSQHLLEGKNWSQLAEERLWWDVAIYGGACQQQLQDANLSGRINSGRGSGLTWFLFHSGLFLWWFSSVAPLVHHFIKTCHSQKVANVLWRHLEEKVTWRDFSSGQDLDENSQNRQQTASGLDWKSKNKWLAQLSDCLPACLPVWRPVCLPVL